MRHMSPESYVEGETGFWLTAMRGQLQGDVTAEWYIWDGDLALKL